MVGAGDPADQSIEFRAGAGTEEFRKIQRLPGNKQFDSGSADHFSRMRPADLTHRSFLCLDRLTDLSYNQADHR